MIIKCIACAFRMHSWFKILPSLCITRAKKKQHYMLRHIEYCWMHEFFFAYHTPTQFFFKRYWLFSLCFFICWFWTRFCMSLFPLFTYFDGETLDEDFLFTFYFACWIYFPFQPPTNKNIPLCFFSRLDFSGLRCRHFLKEKKILSTLIFKLDKYSYRIAIRFSFSIIIIIIIIIIFGW